MKNLSVYCKSLISFTTNFSTLTFLKLNQSTKKKSTISTYENVKLIKAVGLLYFCYIFFNLDASNNSPNNLNSNCVHHLMVKKKYISVKTQLPVLTIKYFCCLTDSPLLDLWLYHTNLELKLTSLPSHLQYLMTTTTLWMAGDNVFATSVCLYQQVIS